MNDLQIIETIIFWTVIVIINEIMLLKRIIKKKALELSIKAIEDSVNKAFHHPSYDEYSQDSKDKIKEEVGVIIDKLKKDLVKLNKNGTTNNK